MTLAQPYRDDSRTSLAFILSALLHILLAMAVVGFFVFRPAPPPTQSKFIEMVAAPQSDSKTDEEAAPEPPNLTLPNLSVPALPAQPQPVEATPVPPTPTVATPPPTAAPALTHTATVAPKPPAKQPQLTDYQKFLQQQKLSNAPTTAQAHTTGRPVPSVGVNVNSIVKNLNNAGSGANGQGRGNANAASSSSDQDYRAMLVARLREAFVPPGGVSGLSAGIHIQIGSDGSLIVKTLTRPSGNADFDEAVRQALQLLTNVDPPPGGIQVEYNFTFTPAG